MAGAAVVPTRLVSGVRVHVGGQASALLGGGGEDAIVSDET
jgi:hypothetical protein